MPDFRIWLDDGRELTIECKNALSETYKDGDPKVETQKTRDSGAGRKYAYDAFDIVAACMFPVTKRWMFKFKWAPRSHTMEQRQHKDRSHPANRRHLGRLPRRTVPT